MTQDYKVKDISLSNWGLKEIAIAETQDGQHFGNGKFEGYCGWDSDVDLEVQSVERTDGEEDDEDEDEDDD